MHLVLIMHWLIKLNHVNYNCGWSDPTGGKFSRNRVGVTLQEGSSPGTGLKNPVIEYVMSFSYLYMSPVRWVRH